MKIIEIDIKEFGGLKNFKKSFGDGVNTVFEPNGFGKTTVAAFIKAMLYGFQMQRGSDVSQNQRLKMTPWNGADFGGSMTVETGGGQRYRIERVFNTHGYMDIVNVVNVETKAAENELLPVPGDKLLKVGSENFDRCVYTPQNRVRTGNDPALTARLGRALEENGGGASLVKAAGALQDYINALAGEEGRLSRITGEIAKVERQIKAADSRRAKQLADVGQKAELKARLVKYEAEIELIKRSRIPQVELNKAAALYQKIERQRQDKLKQVEAMGGHLTGRKLTADERAELDGYLGRIGELQNSAVDSKKTDDTKKINNADDQNSPLNERGARQGGVFDNSQSDAARDAAVLKEKLKAKKSAAASRGKIAAWIMFAATVLCLAGAAVCFALSGIAGGIVLAAAAVIAAGVGVYFWRAAGKVKPKAQSEDEHPDAACHGDTVPDPACRETCPPDPAADRNSQFSILNSQLEDCDPQNSPLEGCPRIPLDEGGVAEAELLTEKALMIAARAFHGVDTLEKLARAVQTFDADYAALELAKKEAAGFDETLAGIKEELKDADGSLLVRKFTEEDFDLKIPQKRLKFLETCVKNIIEQVGRIEGAAAASLETPLNRAGLKQLYNNLIKDRDEMEYVIYCVDSAGYHLNEGREQLLNNYAPPLKEIMSGYMKELSYGKHSRLSAGLDKDLNLYIEADGEQRDLAYFSQGLQDLAYFALRMSMLDLIYQKEKPFIILDEPFVNYDDKHMEMARALLNKIAADKQIIYMTSQSAHVV